MAKSKIPIIESMESNIWLCFEEADVRKACQFEKCSKDIIDNCVANMKEEGRNECVSCYINLINEIKAIPEYKRICLIEQALKGGE